MSDESDVDVIPDSRTGRIRYSVTNLWDDFGNTSHVGLGVTVNVGLAAIGGLVYWQSSGVLAFIGFVWMLINLFGILKWVIEA